ncbi:hypothetical protein BBP40_002233 [Aspergillus hancockii]|nr:hypothetical protein BBP40_002233 [Aspergillus hancockii]
MAEHGNSDILKGWRNERFPVYGPGGKLVLEIERSASARFGIVTSGVQMLCFVEDEKKGICLWIAKRSEKKQTYPGMLDCTAAGALTVGESPRSAIILEATEEASLEKEMIEKSMRSVGCISYFHVKESTIGNENTPAALLLPETEYVYELKLDQQTVPRPKDSEVEDFRLWGVDQVLEALRNGLFKPNSAVVVIEFFIRHGIITAETEQRYLEIIKRLHRRLPFPTAQKFIAKHIEDVGWYGRALFFTTCRFQLFFGKLYTLLSLKWAFIGALIVLEVGSAVYGANPSSIVFIVGRAIASIGGAGIFSGALSIIAKAAL